MKFLRDLPPGGERRFRRSLVLGRDGKHYTVLTFQLYERTPPPEYANFELNVIETDAEGRYQVLNQPLLRRFFTKEEALKAHEDVLERFDEVLQIPQPKAGKGEKEPEGGH